MTLNGICAIVTKIKLLFKTITMKNSMYNYTYVDIIMQ